MSASWLPLPPSTMKPPSLPLPSLLQVQRDFEELPPSALPGLRDSLISLLVQFGQGSAPVRTQLCLAVAALAAHLPVVHWGPTGVVGWLAQRLSSEPQEVSLPCMLELLTVLPQVREGEGGGDGVGLGGLGGVRDARGFWQCWMGRCCSLLWKEGRGRLDVFECSRAGGARRKVTVG